MSGTSNFALVHGGGMGAWAWADTITELEAQSGGRARCLALDVPGCGQKRNRDIGTLDIDDVARELTAEIDDSGMRDVVLVGHSQAGMLIPRMVESAPTLFGRLIYLTCSAPPPGTSIMDLLGQGRHGERDDEIGWPVDMATTPLLESFRAMFCNDMSVPDQEAFLAKMGQDSWPPATYTYADWRYEHLRSLPTCYVVCTQDMVLPPEWQHRFAARLHADTTVEIAAGHQAMNTAPDAVARVLLAHAVKR